MIKGVRVIDFILLKSMTLTPLMEINDSDPFDGAWILRSKRYFRISAQTPGYKKECF